MEAASVVLSQRCLARLPEVYGMNTSIERGATGRLRISSLSIIIYRKNRVLLMGEYQKNSDYILGVTALEISEYWKSSAIHKKAET